MLQHGKTALYLAAWEGRVEVVKVLLKHDAAVDIRTKVTNYPVTFGWSFGCGFTTNHARVDDCTL